MRRPRSIATRFLAYATLLCITTGLTPAAVPQTETQPVVRVGAGPDDQSAPLLYAAKAGIFKKYGLNVEIVKLGGSAAIAAALAGGSLEIGKGSPMGVVTAFARGLPFVIIGNIAYYDAARPDIALVVGANVQLGSAKEFAGKTLSAVSISDLNSVATYAWLDAHGVDPSTVKYVEMPASAALAAMEQSRIAGSTLYEPYLTTSTGSGKARIFGYPFDAIAKRFSSAVLFTNAQWAAEHRDTVDKFLRATQEAATYIGAHDSVATALIAEFGGIDPATIGSIRHPERGVTIEPLDVQPVIDAAARYKVIPKAFPASDMLCVCAMRKEPRSAMGVTGRFASSGAGTRVAAVAASGTGLKK